MIRLPPRSTPTYTHFPYTARFRSPGFLSGEVLVGVDTDRPDVAGLEGCLEETATGAAGRVVDHVGASAVLTEGGLLALGGVVEAGEVGGQLGTEHLATPFTNAHAVSRFRLDNKTLTAMNHDPHH